MIDLDLAQAAFWFAVTFAVCEALAIVFGVALAWLIADSLKR